MKKLGYWVICVNSYDFEGKYTPKGRMNYHTSTFPIINTDWRRATEEEIETKKWFKGNFYNHYWL